MLPVFVIGLVRRVVMDRGVGDVVGLFVSGRLFVNENLFARI